LANAFVAKMEKDVMYRLGGGDPVKRAITADGIDAEALLRGTIELLHEGTPDTRRTAARFLGRLGDASAIVPLVGALDDPDAELREEACHSLRALGTNGEPAESALFTICRTDPAIDVRVAAVLALKRPTDKDALAAFELGVRTTKNPWVREVCEEELEKLGKLHLPLPDAVYALLRQKEFEIMKKRFRTDVRRKTKKGDTTYVELVESFPDAIPRQTHWFKFKDEAAGAEPKGTSGK
jgi:HEAT repeat protein